MALTSELTTPTSVMALGPESMVWKQAGDNLQLLLAGTTLALQVSHPVVGAGVGDHSVFKKDPWGRLKRTTEWGLRLLYGGQEKAPKAGQALRDLHRDIKGTDSQGRRYFALDPEAYAWVHMTTYFTLIKTQELFGDRPYTQTEAGQMFREWRQQGRVMGIRDEHMPPTAEAFWPYLDNMIAHRLEDNETVRYLLGTSLERAKKPPQLSLLPTAVWRLLYRQSGKQIRLCALASMPPALREKLHLTWTPKDERKFRRLQRMIRAAAPLIPLKLRYLPPAYEALASGR